MMAERARGAGSGRSEINGVVRRVSDWAGASGRAQRRPFTWSRFLWSLVYPKRGDRIRPTLPGVILVALSMGIGTAAYNSSSNILFMTLSLLLACLILSGVLSWLNLRAVSWQLQLAPPWRAGVEAVVALDLRNAKRVLPTYALEFALTARLQAAEKEQKAESTVSARPTDVRAALAQAELKEIRGQVSLAQRLDARGVGQVEWRFKPEHRGRWLVELAGVGSFFPFGFLRKDTGTELALLATVWPAEVVYQRVGQAAGRRVAAGDRVGRAGLGGDMLDLRRYAAGDSHRLIHWKASARMRTLLVRQLAGERTAGYALWLKTDARVWSRPEQFELLLRLVATLAHDLFIARELTSVALDDEPPRIVRRRHDLEAWWDLLATVSTHHREQPMAESIPTQKNIMMFFPEGVHGVSAVVAGQKVAEV